MTEEVRGVLAAKWAWGEFRGLGTVIHSPQTRVCVLVQEAFSEDRLKKKKEKKNPKTPVFNRGYEKRHGSNLGTFLPSGPSCDNLL